MIPQKLRDRDRVFIVDQKRRLPGRTGINNDVDLGTARGQLRPIFDLLESFQSSDALEFRRMIGLRIRRRIQIVFAKRRYRKFARLFRF